ncbi:MAG TPA: MBL fold metallo-hydrolase [Streptosporangiaceae bacterium]
MSVAEVRMHVLDVGQGSCNYVEIVDDNEVVIHNMLIDLGTNSAQKIAADNLQWLIERIEDRDDPRIDVVILTHGDTDHYNMMLKLLPALNPADTERIGMVRYGGSSSRYNIGKTPLITALWNYCDDVSTFTPSQSSYDQATQTWTPVWPASPQTGDVKLQLIAANTPHPCDAQKKNGEAINTKSVVTAIHWHNYWMIASGDATATTLAEVNDILTGVTHDDLPTAFLLTMPHHGSRKTTYDLRKAGDWPGDAAREVVDGFLETFRPMTMSVSAGEKHHHHPSMLMVEQFALYAYPHYTFWSDPALTQDRHFLTCWVDLPITGQGVTPAWPSGWLYNTTQTSLNVYSTLYFKSDPYNRKLAKKGGGSYYLRFQCPPLPATEFRDSVPQAGIPAGRNWHFYMGTNVWVESTENAARAAATADFVIARHAPWPSGPFPPPALQPPARGLRSLRALR